MRLRNTLLLGLLFVALSGYLYFVERENVAQEEKKQTLLDVATDDISEVTLTYPDREIVLTKTAGVWGLTKPVVAQADDTTVKNLVRAIAECEVKKTLEESPQTVTTYGLDTPGIKIRVAAGAKNFPEIRIGKNAPVGYSTYVQLGEKGKVVLTGSAFESGMKKEVKDLRDKQILSVSEDAMTRVTVTTPGSEVVLVRTDGKWKIEKPIPAEVDDSTVSTFLSSIRNLRATDFISEEASDLSAFGLDNPRVSVVIETSQASEKKQFFIGSENDKKEVSLKVADRPTIYSVSDFVFRDVNKTADDFRDKTAIAFETQDVRRISIERSATDKLVFVRTAEGWRVDGTESIPESAKVDRYLEDLHGLKGYEVASKDPAEFARLGLVLPVLVVQIDDAKGSIGYVRVGTYPGIEDKPEYVVARDGSATAFKIREFGYTRLNKRLADFLPQPTPTPASPQP